MYNIENICITNYNDRTYINKYLSVIIVTTTIISVLTLKALSILVFEVNFRVCGENSITSKISMYTKETILYLTHKQI